MKSTEEITYRQGGCQCGGIRYEVKGPMRPVVACHCRICQRTSGHFVAATQTLQRYLTITQGASLMRWYTAPETAERSFCSQCGSQLFWRQFDADTVSVMAGSLDQPTQLKIAAHIYGECQGDYYQISDGLPNVEHADLADHMPPAAWQ